MYSLQESLKNKHCNTVVFKENNTVHCNTVNKMTKDDVARADRLADRMVAKLNNPSRRPYYCKVAYSLSENVIEVALERSLKKEHPERYFSWLTNMEMKGEAVVL